MEDLKKFLGKYCGAIIGIIVAIVILATRLYDVIIGIVSKHYASYKNERTDTFIRDEVKQAIFDNGGIAIGILPTEKEINYLKGMYDKKIYC